MRLFVDPGDPNEGPRSVAISIDDPHSTVSVLAVALGLADSALVVDGVVHLGDVPLSNVALVEGSRVGPVGPHQERASGIGRSWVGVVAGPEAGAVRRLDSDGTVTIGRGPLNDLRINNSTVSVRQASIGRTKSGLHIEDHGSTNGTWVDGRPVAKRTTLPLETPVRIGSSTIEFLEVNIDDKPLATSPSHAGEDGRVLFNRAPRGPVPLAPEAVTIPDALPERKNPTLRIVSLLIPLVIAGVMVVAFGSFRYALFALFSPLMMLGNWFSTRRSTKKERAGDVRNRREALALLRSDLEQAELCERHRRQAIAPHLLEIRRRVELPSTRLWERRLSSPDALTIRLGVGTITWDPSGGATAARETDDADVAELIEERAELDGVEILGDLRRGPIGFIGDESHAHKAARLALLQLATHHGPADISVAILTTKEKAAEWQWAQWLPHTGTENGGVRLLCGDEAKSYASSLLEAVTSDRPSVAAPSLRPAVLLVVDDLDVLHQRSSAVRQLLERTDQHLFGLVLAPVADQLPASVTTVVDIDKRDGEFVRTTPANPDVIETGIIDGVSTEVASEIARAMARFDDPEMTTPGGAVPTSVSASDVLPVPIIEPPHTSQSDESAGDTIASIRRNWMLAKRTSKLAATIGMSDAGPFTVDLVQDGPHALVAGTTGAGKSELLRTLVLSLATNHDPDDLVFVLIDYKGGSAFDRCAALPHVVGLVTDLDDHLAQRALHSLEAELHHRETVLRLSQASDISEYGKVGSPKGPLPRLVVVIDEFATMRNELPDFVSSLVGIAQRGRSLGVHLVLATQRPSGAVDANIRANTNLRVALRVQDASDSTDVIDDPAAALITREQSGRAFVRRGEGDLALVQTAYVSGPVNPDGPPIRVAEVPLGPAAPSFPEPPADPGAEVAGSVQRTSLDVIVELLTEAASEYAEPRRPWLEELPTHISDPADIVDLEPGDDSHVVLAVADEPRRQRRVTRGWNLDNGHLAVIGGPGSGVTTTLRSAVTALDADSERRSVWIFPVDHGAGGLTGIDRFAHVADVIAGTDEKRQSRLLHFVSEALDERKGEPFENLGQLPLIVIVIDGVSSFCEVNDISSGTPNADLLTRIGRDGPAHGIYLLIGAGAPNELPRALRNMVNQNVVLEQVDARSYTEFGIRGRNLPSLAPGRALFDSEPILGQIIDWENAADRGFFKVSQDGAVPSIERLPIEIPLGELPVAEVGVDLSIPVGIADRTRSPASLRIRAGEHGLISGPSRSGRTTALSAIARQLREADDKLVLVGLAPSTASPLFDESVLDAAGTPDDLEHVLNSALEDDRRWVILVDDADRIELEHGSLFELARNGLPNVTIIAAVRSSVARQAYGHWTRFIRTSGTGILLEPDPAADGELLGVRLPRNKRLEPVPGRAYIVQAGEIEEAQLARP